MTTYRVLNTLLRRHSVALRVEQEEHCAEAECVRHEGDEVTLCVLGEPEKTIKFRSFDFIWDGDQITNQRVLVIEPVTFPIEDLSGKIILSE